jgi:alpha-D-xyloside xylohydrolase
MDFSGDPVARETGDQYMFGKELLVCPVTSYKARERSVYLPKGLWYDFWSGHGIQGGRTITAPAPYDQIPIFVRAGSILPVGPPLQYTSEKPADPLTLVVYPGLSGSFNLYEDDGKSYGYEKGLCSTIPFAWDDIKQTLTIGKRVGAFPVMLQSRTFRVVLQHGTGGYPFPQDGAVQVAYKGEKLTLKFARKG